jgi:hypothetical protein
MVPAERVILVEGPLELADDPDVVCRGTTRGTAGSCTGATRFRLPKASSSQDGYLAAGDFASFASALLPVLTGTCGTSAGAQTPTTVLQVPALDGGLYSLRLVLHGRSTTGSGAAFLAEYAIQVAIVGGVIAASDVQHLGLVDTGRLTARGGIIGCADNLSGAIRVTCDAPHNLFTGMKVGVQGVGGTTEANGTWPVTVIDGVTFDLQGSSFVHTYTSGGAFARGGGLLGLSWAGGTLGVVVQGVGELVIAWSAKAQVF